jgi:dihydrolipoamide dehydrogenase
VTVVELTGGLLPGVDRDLVGIVAKRLEGEFQAIWLKTKVVALQEESQGIRVTFEGAEAQHTEQVFDKVLIAVGRTPNSSGMGLHSTRVAIDQRGFVQVDEQRRTAEASIFAIGDLTGEPMLAHKAAHEGRVAVEVIAGHRAAFAPQAIPAVVFTDPEIAWCGLTETQARQQNRRVQVARFPWAASGRATTLDRPEGVTKLLIDPETERILGVGIVGYGAGELIAEGVLAVEMAALASDMKLSIPPIPPFLKRSWRRRRSFLARARISIDRRERGRSPAVRLDSRGGEPLECPYWCSRVNTTNYTICTGARVMDIRIEYCIE